MEQRGKGLTLLNSGYQLLSALAKGPAQSYEELHRAQYERYQVFADFNQHFGSRDPKTIHARQQYWCAQLLFTLKLIQNNSKKLQNICELSIPDFQNTTLVGEYLMALVKTLENPNRTAEFVKILLEDGDEILKNHQNKVINAELSADVLHIYQGDVIEVIKSLQQQNYLPIIDNAANSHRDGAAKYSSGSLEELLSRFTDQALKLALHFEDVHHRNTQDAQSAFPTEKHPDINILDYQKRYFQMVLTILSQLILNGEDYLVTPKFFNDLFHSFPNPNPAPGCAPLPIYFDLQNNCYEVPIKQGFTGYHHFRDTRKLQRVTEVIAALQQHEAALIVASYAAPDQRKIETSPLDRRATSNTILQTPSKPETLETMIRQGVSYHCQLAINLTKQKKLPVAAVLILPGCGGFANPPEPTAKYFISELQKYLPEIRQLKIPCMIVELNQSLLTTLIQTCKKTLSEEALKIMTNQSSHEFDLPNQTRMKITVSNLKMEASEKDYYFIPENLSIKNSFSVGWQKPINMISMPTIKKQEANSQQKLMYCYLSGLTEALKRSKIENIHCILMGSGNQGFSTEESMRALLNAISKLNTRLPNIVLHINEQKPQDFKICFNVTQAYLNEVASLNNQGRPFKDEASSFI